jgi:hypothetical protein
MAEVPDKKDSADDQQCRQWQVMQAENLMPKLQRHAFISGKCMGVRSRGNRQ